MSLLLSATLLRVHFVCAVRCYSGWDTFTVSHDSLLLFSLLIFLLDLSRMFCVLLC